MDATVASASPQRAETPRTTSSRERAPVVLLTDSTKRYSDRIAPTARTEARNRESLTRGDHQPGPSRAFVPDDVAEDTALLEVVEQFRAVHLFLRPLGDYGQCDELAMRMLQRRPGRLSVILEQQDVAKPAVLLEIAHSVLESPEDFLDLPLRHFSHGDGMVGGFDDDLVRADAVHLVVHPFALPVELAFDAEHRELVRHHANAPTGLVAAAAGSVGQNLGRGLVFVTRVEGANAGGGRRHRLPDKVVGAFGAIGRDDYPSPHDGVLT